MSDLSESIVDVARSVVKGLNTVGTNVRQAKITAIAAGPPRTATIEIGGISVAGVLLMDHVTPTINEGVWFADMGEGRWIIIGANGYTTPWTNVTFSTGYADYSVGTFGNTQYRRVGDVVYLRGLAKTTSSRAAGDPMFVLPTGFRPSRQELSYVAMYDTATESPRRIDIYTDGNVKPAPALAIGSYVSLVGMQFSVA